jgi:shikimate dehydrogenase
LVSEGIGALWLVNRTESKARDLALELQPTTGAPVEVGYPPGEVDLVLNATSAGLKADDPLPFDPGRWDPGRATSAYDMIYRPAETRFLAMARETGCRTANGLGMLLYQGVAALEIWAGRPAPVEEMRKALWENVYGVGR